MAKKEETQVKKKEAESHNIERTSSRRTFIPQTDILENETGLVVIMDIPGVAEQDVDIRVNDNVLTVVAKVNDVKYEGYRQLYAEYNTGDYQRSFRLTDEFNTEGIVAKMEQGVLTLSLPKAEKKKPRKIEIKAG